MDPGRVEVNAEVDPAQQLPAGDAAGPAHPACVDGDSERDGLAGEAAKQGRVHVEAES